ncbi:DUF4012 domain-containing protein [Planosporangium mesophilum]|nr:DUF4012 domain-containing protein [Planosporangium mesophilum]NJC85095.1 DUF4012 domain-containing protein [Planosporangium mesophilum]
MVAVVVVTACLATAAVWWIGARGLGAGEHLRTAGLMLRQLQDQVEQGDIDAARRTLTALRRETGAARGETGDVGFRLGAAVPVAGADLAAVRTVAVTVDDLARDALPPLVEAAGVVDLDALTPRDGRVDLAAFRRAAPGVARAATAVRVARQRVDAIADDHLMSQTRAGVTELRAGLERAARITDLAQRFSVLLPAMLGAGGPRTYLLLFQNLAEARATGGMPGAFLVVEADDGAVRIIDQGTAATGLGTFDSPVLPLDPALRALYTDSLGQHPADINLTPHFPTVASLAREMYRRRTGRTVDAVLATDPVALSYVLGATGPAEVSSGEPLWSDNAVPTLLSEVYATMTPAEQDRYFAVAARGAFDALVGQARDMSQLVQQLARAMGERRVLLWNADPAEQRLIEGTTLDGQLPTTDGTTPTVGIFLNDRTGAKLDYYLTYAAELTAMNCRPDGSRELNLRVTLGSTAPTKGLAPGVTGEALAGERYTMRTDVSVFSPTGGTVTGARLDGAPVPLVTGIERQRSVGISTVDLKPGSFRTLEVTMLTGAPPAGAGPVLGPRIWTSPGVRPWNVNVQPAEPCRARR